MDRYLLQIMLAKGIGNVALKRVMRYVSIHPEESFQLLCEDTDRFASIFKFKPAIIESIKECAQHAANLSTELSRNGISIISEVDELYPKQLKSSLGDQCPPVIFAQGNLQLLNTNSVGFCGSRKVSPKGIIITQQCAEQLTRKNITVVSGYAAGTDLAAHSAAMLSGGNTIFVLAEGILRFSKKREIKELINPSNSLFISQFLPETVWNAGNAMKRNSVIIGLSKAMILVESGRTGGTFAAGEETLSRHLPLFVIDYAQPEVSAEANPYFISRGGYPIRGTNGIPNLGKVFSAVSATSQTQESFEQLSINL